MRYRRTKQEALHYAVHWLFCTFGARVQLFGHVSGTSRVIGLELFATRSLPLSADVISGQVYIQLTSQILTSTPRWRSLCGSSFHDTTRDGIFPDLTAHCSQSWHIYTKLCHDRWRVRGRVSRVNGHKPELVRQLS